MNASDYVKTLYVGGKEIKLGMDDPGQCYYIEWEENGETKEMGLGTYNFHYLESIYYLFDPIYKELSKLNLFDRLTEENKEVFEKYQKMFREEYNE